MYLDATSHNTGYTIPPKFLFGELRKNTQNVNPDSI